MQWSPVAPLLVGVSCPAVVSHGNDIYVAEGSCRGQDSSSVQVYHETTGTWEYGAELGAGKCDTAAVVVSLPAVEHSLVTKK
ncbi:hypothetical protein Aduo_009328 [Ancylostoma duodenale]